MGRHRLYPELGPLCPPSLDNLALTNQCPRYYGDSFALMKAARSNVSVPINRCYQLFKNKDSPEQYCEKPLGKWGIFMDEGWLSDFTNQTVIDIKLSQPMLVRVITYIFWLQFSTEQHIL